jgi:serine/threonine-protein kinase RsbW
VPARRIVRRDDEKGGPVDRTTRTAVLTTPPRDLAVVYELLQAFWSDLPDLEPLDRFAFETALVELAGNVVEHADDGDGVTCTIRLTAEEHSIAAQLQDTGRVADVLLAERTMPDPLAERGRGLAIVQRLVDDLAYERDGAVNRWRFVRHLQPA